MWPPGVAGDKPRGVPRVLRRRPPPRPAGAPCDARRDRRDLQRAGRGCGAGGAYRLSFRQAVVESAGPAVSVAAFAALRRSSRHRIPAVRRIPAIKTPALVAAVATVARTLVRVRRPDRLNPNP